MYQVLILKNTALCLFEKMEPHAKNAGDIGNKTRV